MPRLPSVGSDSGAWGGILNSYLQVGHDAAGHHLAFYDVKEYGAVGNGITDDTAAINLAIAAVKVTGGTLLFRPGTYLCSSALTATNLLNVRFEGLGAGPNSTYGAWLLYTGSGSGTFLDLSGGNGVRLQGLGIAYNSGSFTGTLVKFAVTNGSIRDCSLRGTGGAASATYLLSLDTAIDVLVEETYFAYSTYSVLGQAPSGSSYSNIVGFRNCDFDVQVSTCHVRNPGASWVFDACDFENLANNKGGAITMDAACTSLGCSLLGCWMGDATDSTAWTWVTWQGSGLVVSGCKISGHTGDTAISILGASTGVTITGNRLDNHAVGVAIGAGTLTSAPVIFGNDYTNTTTQVSGRPVAGAPAFIEYTNSGATATLQAVGNMAVGAGGGASILFQVGGNNVVIAGAQNTRIVNALQRTTQTPAASGTVAIDPTQGDVFIWSAETSNALTGNLTISNPSNGAAGQEIEFDLQQDATGGRSVTFGSNYKLSWTPNTGASLRNTIRFRCTDGTRWVQVGAAGVGLPA